jgi:DNA helicase-2/ATP-dependent DNA helicase PcrA
MSTSDEGLPDLPRLPPTPRQETPNISISFSELKYLLDCPYQFKLRFMYGFNPPIHEALGYGKGLHDALAEMHKRALAGDVPTKAETEMLVDRHLHTPTRTRPFEISCVVRRLRPSIGTSTDMVET